MDRESLSVKDGRFTNCDTQPTEATLQGAAILSEFTVMVVSIFIALMSGGLVTCWQLGYLFCREALCICDLERATALSSSALAIDDRSVAVGN